MLIVDPSSVACVFVAVHRPFHLGSRLDDTALYVSSTHVVTPDEPHGIISNVLNVMSLRHCRRVGDEWVDVVAILFLDGSALRFYRFMSSCLRSHVKESMRQSVLTPWIPRGSLRSFASQLDGVSLEASGRCSRGRLLLLPGEGWH
jgi:hypothetical protein